MPTIDIHWSEVYREHPHSAPESVRIPLMDCCDRLPWDCECAWSCVRCRDVLRGQGECGGCCGGY